MEERRIASRSWRIVQRLGFQVAVFGAAALDDCLALTGLAVLMHMVGVALQ